MPRTTSTIPVARLSVFGAALFANTAAIRAHGYDPVWKDWDAVFDR